MPQLSTAVRNAMGNAIETAIGASPVLEYRTGLPPASPAAASSGQLLMSGALPADWAADAANGVKSFNANMKADAAVGAGQASAQLAPALFSGRAGAIVAGSGAGMLGAIVGAGSGSPPAPPIVVPAGRSLTLATSGSRRLALTTAGSRRLTI